MFLCSCSGNEVKSGLKRAANDNSFKSEFKINAEISSKNEDSSILEIKADSNLSENPFGLYVDISMKTADEQNATSAKNYIVKNGDKYITYSEDSGTWFKTETNKSVADVMIERYTGKIIWKQILQYSDNFIADTSNSSDSSTKKYILKVPKDKMTEFFNTTGVLDFVGLSGLTENEIEKVDGFEVSVVFDNDMPISAEFNLANVVQAVFDKIMNDSGITDENERVKIDKYVVSVNILDYDFHQEIIIPDEAKDAIDLTINDDINNNNKINNETNDNGKKKEK